MTTDALLHLDRYLNDWAAMLGPWLYVVLFLTIFCETGLVVTPYLPGDSLLLAVGALSAREGSPIRLAQVTLLLWAAAVRTFAPFVAGIGRMSYPKFVLYNMVGGALWTFSLLLAGHRFAELREVQQHFHYIIWAIIVLSVMLAVFEYWKEHRNRRTNSMNKEKDFRKETGGHL